MFPVFIHNFILLHLTHKISDSFFERVQAFTPIISDDNMSSCEMDLSLEELDVIIHKSPLNKSPGPDGLPFEFYRTFWQDIKSLF